MLTMKTTLLSVALAAGVLAAGNASAAQFQIWDGSSWQLSGGAGTVDTTLVGPTNALYLGNQLPCNASFGLDIVAGVATVTAASFSGSGPCAAILARNLPWPVTITGGSAPSWSVSVNNVNVRIPFPGTPADCPSATGGGTINGTLTDGSPTTIPAVYQFPSQPLGPCSVLSRPAHLKSPANVGNVRIVP